jgi:hypothetical protein
MSSTPGSPPPSASPVSPVSCYAVDRWPPRAEFLTDSSRCPSCFTQLTASSFRSGPAGVRGPVCGNCGLDLSGAEASEIFAAGSRIAAEESHRQELLRRMRNDQAERENAAAIAARNLMTSSTGQPAPYPVFPQPEQPQAPTPPVNVGSSLAPDRPRRSGIQILMLTVGVILVSIMAIFFVLLAYLVASLEVRSVLTGLASVAVLGVAWLLHRRRLSGTAQGIAVLAVVLLLLDLWIVRANDLFGSGGLDGWVYSGIATGVLAGALTLAFRVLPLRSLSISVVLLGPFAAFALTLGILGDAEPTIPVWAALTAVAAAALTWPWIRFGAVERNVVRCVGLVAAAAAILPASFTFRSWDAGQLIGIGLLACVWFGHLLLSPPTANAGSGVTNAGSPVSADPQPSAHPVLRKPRPAGTQVLAALGLGITVASSGPALWYRLPDPTAWLLVPATVTMLGALLLALATRIPAVSARAQLVAGAAAIPGAVAALAILPAAVVVLSQFSALLMVRPFSLRVLDELPLVLPDSRWTVALALATTAALMLAALSLLGQRKQAGLAPAALGGLGLLAVGFAADSPAATALTLLVVAVACVVATGSQRVPPRYRAVSALTAAFSTVGLFLVGVTNTGTFPFAVLATLALAPWFRDVIRRITRPVAAQWVTPVVIAAIAIVLLSSVRLIPEWFQTVTGATAAQGSPALLVTLCAVAILMTIPAMVDVLSRPEAAAATATAVLPLGAGLVELGARTPVDAVPFLIGCGAAAFAAVVWQLVRSVAAWPERHVAALLAPPLTVLFASVLADQVEHILVPVTGSAVVLVLAGIALPLFRDSAANSPMAQGAKPSRVARAAWDTALGIIAAVLLVFTAADADAGWLVLLLLAAASLIVASGDGGIFHGTSPRRHLAWVGLPLAVAALWTALWRTDQAVVEFYTLPVSALLLVVLSLILLRRPLPTNGSGRTALLSAAMGVALLPSAVDVIEPLRGALVLAVSTLLVVAGPFLPARVRGTYCAAVIWVAGALTGVVSLIARVVQGEPDGWQNEAIASALLVGGILWLYRRQLPRNFGTVAVALSPTVVALPLAGAMFTEEVELWQPLMALAFACALSVTAAVPRWRSPLVRWTALSAAIVVAIAAVATAVADPFEWATVPVALALLIAGALRLRADPAARSWPQLGAGLIVFLAPSLLVDFGVNELWRVVVLGVVAFAVLGVGLALRLGAPTLVGAGVLVIHGIAQLWPWIAGLYGVIPWWLWAGIGGVILIFLAATYEKRIRDLRSVARSISSLR